MLSKPQMRENSRVPVAAVQELVSRQSQPQSGTQEFMYPKDICSGPPLSQGSPMQWKKIVKPNKLDSRRKYIAGLSLLLFFLC